MDEARRRRGRNVLNLGLLYRMSERNCIKDQRKHWLDLREKNNFTFCKQNLRKVVGHRQSVWACRKGQVEVGHDEKVDCSRFLNVYLQDGKRIR